LCIDGFSFLNQLKIDIYPNRSILKVNNKFYR
ncbi:MAG: hypothetical protein ACJA1B_003169, partial [Polaribacter sp.]